MAKTVKKKNRKLRRQIRKTVSALLMVSAITIAAIPVQDISAEPGVDTDVKIAVYDDHHYTDTAKYGDLQALNYCKSTVPYVRDYKNTDGSLRYPQIYTSVTNAFQFAYIPAQAGDTTRVAVILRFNSSVFKDGNVVIPSELEAYRKYSESQTNNMYCLVNQNNDFLYYKVMEQLTNSAGKLLYRVRGIQHPTTGEAIIVNEEQLNAEGKYVVEEDPSQTDPSGNIYGTAIDDENLHIDGVPAGIYNVEKVEGLSAAKPCLAEQRDIWKDMADTDLFYEDKDNAGNFLQVSQTTQYKIVAEVRYIGEEKIEENPNSAGTWQLVGTKETGGKWFLDASAADDGIIDEKNEGVFANKGSIQTLGIGSNIEGIGNYAFYNCNNLNSVSFSGNLSTISNGAFAECYGLTAVNMENASNIQAIGKDAFYSCTNLTEFKMPSTVKAIGDSAFEGCTRLSRIDLCTGASGDTNLEKMGYHVFKDCKSLTSLTLPPNYPKTSGDEIDICCFMNCNNLQFIKCENENFMLVDGKTTGDTHKGTGTNVDTGSCGNDSFIKVLDTLPKTFYIEGKPYIGTGTLPTEIHKIANNNEIAFKYLDEEIYEKVVKEKAASGSTPDPAEITYRVNQFNELTYVYIDGKPVNITIPASIGPYGISTIGSGSFNNNNCTLEKVTIPASVTNIGEEAFKGCHNLSSVVFEDATQIQDIGRDAFKTQVTSCGDTLYDPNHPSASIKEPKLTFVGAMMNEAGGDTVPFQYAMNKWAGETNINNPDQEKIWITCHSGWPTNLEVRYNYNAITKVGEAELQSYPRYSIIEGKDDAALRKWIEALPYTEGTCSDAGQGEPGDSNYIPPSTAYIYYNKVVNSIKKHKDPITNGQPTEEEVAIYNSAKNVVVPSSVDSIKDGLFSGLTYDGNDPDEYPDRVDDFTPDTEIETITLNGVNKVESYTFTGCTKLREAAIIGAQTIDDYAFAAFPVDGSGNYIFDYKTRDPEPSPATSLTRVVLGTNIADTTNPDGSKEEGIGVRPFKGCEKLTQIVCMGDNLAYQDGLLFQTSGEKTLVQCLPGRGTAVGLYTVDPEELAGVAKIREEAFEECDGVGKIDLSSSVVEEIPERCFADMEELNTVVLPNTAATIEKDSFVETPRLRVVTIPNSVTYIEKEAFADAGRKTDQIQFECVANSAADRYAKQYDYIKSVQGKVFITHNVYFYDRDPVDPSKTNLLDKQLVNDGEDAVPPTPDPSKAGYVFTGWTPYTKISKDTDVYANYVAEGAKTYTVIFIDGVTGDQLGDVQVIEEGKSATPPTPPEHEGYTYNKWSHDYNNIQKDMIITAQYTDNSGDASRHTVKFVYYDGTQIVTWSTQYIDHEGAATTPQSPTRTGYTFVGWDPADYSSVTENMTITAIFTPGGSGGGGGGGGGGGSGSSPSPGKDGDSKSSTSPSPSATPNPEDSVKKYTVSVSGGSGSGSYPAGAVVAINAYDMGVGQNFDKWTSSTAGVGFANPNASSTTFTMPAANVSVTATYKTGSGSSNSGGSTGGSGSTATKSKANNGTTVQVTKPGISNTNLAGATVSGATDNFIVKVTEDDAAARAVTAALQARYGDLSRIKYLPMDISLYDSEGRTKIADTSGISVNLTLPLPDDLIQYAGNNKVAAIAGGALEDLNTRFTTVDGVPCVNFTATHFSPYVIYVDTANLTQATIDSTPKTGDPIHPKWFLAIGLACISLILFFKRDKVAVKPA